MILAQAPKDLSAMLLVAEPLFVPLESGVLVAPGWDVLCAS